MGNYESTGEEIEGTDPDLMEIQRRIKKVTTYGGMAEAGGASRNGKRICRCKRTYN